MKNVVGTPARRDDFFQRESEVKRIISRIIDGNNINIVAPRRVGKTSILYHLLDNRIENYIYVYVDTEAIDNEQDFYKKIFKAIIKTDQLENANSLPLMLRAGNKILKKIKSIKIIGNSIEFQDNAEMGNYKEELETLLTGMEISSGTRLILMIDEFPQTIQNIAVANKDNRKAAIQFLQSNRELRLNPHINGKVVFIYTGSIGLNHTVAMIEGSAFINDLNSVEINPLSHGDAKSLLTGLLKNKKLKVTDAGCDYLLNKISWLIPFYIQLAVQEIINVSGDEKAVSEEMINTAFTNIISRRHDNHFNDYYSRLKKHFKDGRFDYANTLLCLAAEHGSFDANTALDLSVKYKVSEHYRSILEILIYDGYINNVGNKSIYQFNSPILKMWWNQFICK